MRCRGCAETGCSISSASTSGRCTTAAVKRRRTSTGAAPLFAFTAFATRPRWLARMSRAFLSCLAFERSVAVSTHRQALSALLFFYTKVLGIQLPLMDEIGLPRIQRRLPVVLVGEELAAVFLGLVGVHWLFVQLLYGTGIRITEGLQLADRPHRLWINAAQSCRRSAAGCVSYAKLFITAMSCRWRRRVLRPPA